ncbi:MAG: putative cytokinetic ring protein SteA [Carbonactinosporaceae bacterium]
MSALRRARPVEQPRIIGAARVDRHTRSLAGRLQPGEIAVIDHLDIDRVTAEALVARRPAAVINAAPSISGRYPALGPEVIVGASIPLLDDVGPEVLSHVEEGHQLHVEDCLVYRDGVAVAAGVLQSVDSIAMAVTAAQAGVALQLESFAGNTVEHLRRERDLLLDGVGMPDIATDLVGRHAMVVSRGYRHDHELAALRPYIGERHPVLIAVDGGADVLLGAGYRPAIIVGDMDAVSDTALGSGAELVVHANRDGTAPGLDRLEGLGLTGTVFATSCTSEDAALLLADARGAELIVAVGTNATLTEFLDRGRGGMASAFLTRLRVGGKLVDASGAAVLHQRRISLTTLLLLVAAAAVAVLVTLTVSPLGRAYLSSGAAVDLAGPGPGVAL